MADLTPPSSKANTPLRDGPSTTTSVSVPVIGASHLDQMHQRLATPPSPTASESNSGAPTMLGHQNQTGSEQVSALQNQTSDLSVSGPGSRSEGLLGGGVDQGVDVDGMGGGKGKGKGKDAMMDIDAEVAARDGFITVSEQTIDTSSKKARVSPFCWTASSRLLLSCVGDLLITLECLDFINVVQVAAHDSSSN